MGKQDREWLVSPVKCSVGRIGMAVVGIKKLLEAGLWCRRCRCGRRGTPIVAHQVLRCNLAQLHVLIAVSRVQPGLLSAWGLLLPGGLVDSG